MADNELDEHMAEAMKGDIKKLIGMYGLKNIQQAISAEPGSIRTETEGDVNMVIDGVRRVLKKLHKYEGLGIFDQVMGDDLPKEEGSTRINVDYGLYFDVKPSSHVTVYTRLLGVGNLKGGVWQPQEYGQVVKAENLQYMIKLLKEEIPNCEISLNDGGNFYTLPEEIQDVPYPEPMLSFEPSEDVVEPPRPKPMDPSKENYDYHAGTGQWYVSPKK